MVHTSALDPVFLGRSGSLRKGGMAAFFCLSAIPVEAPMKSVLCLMGGSSEVDMWE